MSSYYDDDDFREEYLRRDEEALDWAITEREEALRALAPDQYEEGDF